MDKVHNLQIACIENLITYGKIEQKMQTNVNAKSSLTFLYHTLQKVDYIGKPKGI